MYSDNNNNRNEKYGGYITNQREMEEMDIIGKEGSSAGVNDYHIVEDNTVSSISDKARIGFIRKVYCILSTQLLMTATAVLLSAISESYRYFLITHTWLFYVAFVVSLCSLYALSCYPEVARSVPANYILLLVFTVAESYSISSITTFYTGKSLTYAALITAAIVVSLTIYAFTTDTDFTYMGGTLFMAGAGFLVASMIGIFFESRTYEIIVALFGSLLFGLYLIYDTQLIMGGDGKSASYTIDDYILAAVNVYLDVVSMFIEILRLIGDRR